MTWKTVLKEPLLHFLVLAGVLFFVEMIWSAGQKEPIIVGQQTVNYLIQQREALELRELTRQEREETIAAFVDDEILYNEAYKQGLDRRDTRMRRNLIRKMRGLLMGDVPEPEAADLVQFFDDNRARYTTPDSLSLVQVFYRDASRAPDDLLQQLHAGVDPNSVGDFTVNFGRTLSRYSNRQLSSIFGPETARMVIALDDADWHGPLTSIHGVHFMRITERLPATVARFEDVKAYLAADWMAARSRAAVEEQLEIMRDDYEIIIDMDALKP